MFDGICPGFLIATPKLKDPHFEQTVILLVEHREEGSLGFIVNRPSGATFNAIVDELGLAQDRSPEADSPVLVGGPVAPQTGWIVFDPAVIDAPKEGAIEVTENMCVSASKELLKDIATSKDASRFLLVLGYAGWGAGQLDAEINEGVWMTASVSERIVFDFPLAKRWLAAFAGDAFDPALLVGSTIADA